MSNVEALVLTNDIETNGTDIITAALHAAKVSMRRQQPEVIRFAAGHMPIIDNSEQQLAKRRAAATAWAASLFVVIDALALEQSVVTSEIQSVTQLRKPTILVVASDEEAKIARAQYSGNKLILVASNANDLDEAIIDTFYEAGATIYQPLPNPWLAGIDREQLRYVIEHGQAV